MNWTDLAGEPVYTLTLFGGGIFEIFVFDFGETAQTIGGLQPDTVYEFEIAAYLSDGSEQLATGQMRTLSG